MLYMALSEFVRMDDVRDSGIKEKNLKRVDMYISVNNYIVCVSQCPLSIALHDELVLAAEVEGAEGLLVVLALEEAGLVALQRA